MSRKLIKSTILAAILFTSLFARADETIDALDALKYKVQNLATTLGDPGMSNAKKVQLVKTQRPVFELEMKQILQKEVRTSDNETIHDSAYDAMDDYMIGTAAASMLELKKDGVSIQEESCEKADGMLNMLVRPNSQPYMSFKHAIKVMCSKPSSI